MKPNIYATITTKWGDQVNESSVMFFSDSWRDNLEKACEYIGVANDEDIIGYSIYDLDRARIFVNVEEMMRGAFPCYTWEVGIKGDMLIKDYPEPYKQYRTVQKTWFSNNATSMEDAMKSASEEVKVLESYLELKKDFCIRA